MADSYKLAIKIAAETDQAKSNIDRLNSEFGELLKTLGKTPKDIQVFSKLATDMLATGKAADGLDQETKRLLTTYQQLAGIARSKDILGLVPHDQIARQIDQVESAFNSLRNSGVLTQRELAQAALLTHQKLRELESKTSGVSTALSALRGELAQLGIAATGIGLAVREAVKFESAMADVRKVVDGTEEEMAGLEDTLKAMARELPLSTDALAKIAAAGGQLGIPIQNIEQFTRLAAEMSVAFNMSADQAGQAIAKMTNVFKLSMPEVRSLGDAVNTLGNNSAATEADILEVMTRVGGMSTQFGISAEQTAALATAMLSMGKTPEIAATGINALLGKLQTSTTQSAEFKEGLRALGLEAETFARSIAADPQKAINRFLSSLQGLDKMAKAEILSKMFGQEYQDDIAALVNGMDRYQESLGLVSDKMKSAGALTREYQERAKTTENQLQLLHNAVKEVGNNVGTVFLPAIKKAAEGLAGFTTIMADLADRFPMIAGLAATLGTVAIATNGLKTAWLALQVVIGNIGGSATAALTNMTGNANLAAGAVARIGQAFSILGAALAGWDIGTWLSDEFELVRKSGVFMVEVLMRALEDLQYKWEILKAIATDDTMEAAAERHARRLAEMAGIFESEYKAVEDGVWKARNKAQEGAKGVADAAQKIMNDATSAMQGTVGAATTNLATLSESAAKSMGAAGKEIVSQLTGMQEQGRSMGQTVSDALQVLTNPNISWDEFAKLGLSMANLRHESVEAAQAVDSQLVTALGNLSNKALVDFMGRSQVAFTEAGKSADDFRFILEGGLNAALAKLGVDTEQFRTGMTTAGAAAIEMFTLVGENAQASGAQIAAAFDAALGKVQDLDEINHLREQLQHLGREGRISVDQLAAAMERLEDKAEELSDAVDPVEQAFKSLGITSSKALDVVAQKARQDFETIRNSGVASAGDVQAAFKAYAEKAIAAAEAHGEAQARVVAATLNAQGATLGLREKLQQAGVAGTQAGEDIAKGMDEAAAATRHAAQAAGQMQETVAESGEKQKTSGTGTVDRNAPITWTIPYYEQMGDQLRDSIKHAMKWHGYGTGIIKHFTILRRTIKEAGAQVKEAEAMRKHIESQIKAGGMTSALAGVAESFVRSMDGILNQSQLSYLQGELESYRSGTAGKTPSVPLRRNAQPEVTVQEVPSIKFDEAAVSRAAKPASAARGTAVSADPMGRMTSILSGIADDVSMIASVAARHRAGNAKGIGTEAILNTIAEAASRS